MKNLLSTDLVRNIVNLSGPSPQCSKSPYAKGLAAQSVACKVLIKAGYKILTENYHSRFGEIDIIAMKNDSYSFYEVKSTVGVPKYDLLELLTNAKFNKIFKTSQLWLKENAPNAEAYYFGIIAITYKDKELKKIIKLQHIKNIGKINEIPL